MDFPQQLTEKDRLLKATQMRRDIVEMTNAAGSGHPGGSLSSVEMLVTLYNEYLKHDPNNPKWEDSDVMIYALTGYGEVFEDINPRVAGFNGAYEKSNLVGLLDQIDLLLKEDKKI